MSNKAKDLDTLIRLHRWTVDERQRELGILRTREEELLQQRQALERQMIAEQKIAAGEPIGAGFTFGAFAADHRFRRERLDKAIAAIRVEIEKARDRLGEAYRQLKVYEEVQKQRSERERQEENRQERIVLDEIGQNQYRQLHKTASD